MIKTYKKFFIFAGKQKWNWYKGLIFEVLRCIMEALQFMALLLVLNSLVQDNMSSVTMFTSLAIMMLSAIGTTIMWYFAHTKEGEASYKMCADKRIQIGSRMKYMPMGYFNSYNLGNLTTITTATMSDLESMSFAVIVRTLVGIVHSIIFALTMFLFEWRIGMMFLIGIVLFVFINTLLLNKYAKLSPERLKSQAQFMDAVLEYIQGMGVVKAFNLTKRSGTKLENAIKDTQSKNEIIEKERIPYIVIEQIILRVIGTIIAFCAILFFLNGVFDLSICLMVLVSSFIVYGQLESTGEMFFMLSMIDASINRIQEVNGSPQMDIDGKDQQPKTFDIQFENVCFSYADKQVINDVSFNITQGTTTAIVGPSGSGKSTLVNLLARFWDTNKGSIKIGGIDVKDYKLDSLMKNISMVFQNVYLFNDTIANNIKFGKQNTTQEEIENACKSACCHDFIMALPNGYDTIIGEGGASLSGGEKQRISIARAIMKNASIIILDEATANVDPENEQELQLAIHSLTKGKTVIMIAHRLKTVKNADCILVMDKGNIVQQGTHSELILVDGIYKKFVQIRQKAEQWSL